jgi:hypothetical protein
VTLCCINLFHSTTYLIPMIFNCFLSLYIVLYPCPHILKQEDRNFFFAILNENSVIIVVILNFETAFFFHSTQKNSIEKLVTICQKT